MKRQWFIILFTIFSIAAYAQTIGSFLDFHLGQSKYEVQRIVNSKYHGAEWENNLCKIQDVSLAGESFMLLALEFQNGKLSSSTFSKNYTFAQIVSGYNNAVRTMDNALQMASGMISRLYATYASRYGKEKVITDNSIIWSGNNGNSIKIALVKEIVNIGGNDYGLNCCVQVNYYSSNNDNY